MKFKEEKVANKTIVKILDVPKGQLDLEFSEKLKIQFDKKIEGGNMDIVVDLGDINYIDSASIGLFVEILNIVRNNNGSLAFLNVNDRIKKIFEVTNLLKYFHIYSSKDEIE